MTLVSWVLVVPIETLGFGSPSKATTLARTFNWI
jgi:hypothetical protein